MWVSLAGGVSYWSKCGLSISYWRECGVLAASHWGSNGICPKYQLVGETGVSAVSEGRYTGDPAGGWSRIWVTACVPGTSRWSGRVSVSSLNRVCVGCPCVFTGKPQAGPASKQEILGLV